MDLNFVLKDDVFEVIKEMKRCRDSMLSYDISPKQAADEYIKLGQLTKLVSDMLIIHKQSVNNLAWNRGSREE